MRAGLGIVEAHVALGETLCYLGDYTAAWPHLEQGMVLIAPTVEAYRLQGALRRCQAPAETTQAEACFQQALAVARRQQAKSWELRAALSLSHLWHQQGKQAEARELLAPIYDWFTEGFDTPDLQEAKVLLEELAG